MRARPPIDNTVDSVDKKNDFINAADKKINIEENIDKKKSDGFAWENKKVRDDLIKTFNLRLSEPDYLKLKFISENTVDSMHIFCLNNLIPAIEKTIKNLTKK